MARTRRLLFWLCIVLVVAPFGSFLLLSLGVMTYIYWPTDVDELVVPGVEPNVEHVVVVAHGMRDTPATWSDRLAQALATRGEREQIVSLDWSAYAQNAFRCSVNGRRLGESLGTDLAANPNLQSLHLIAHSCGSFVSFGICEALREERTDVTIQSTFLDPVTVYGGIFWRFGLERFGSCADFSDAYIDTEDDVPGSNQLLPSTHTFDITDARKRAGYTGAPHVWPTIYYLRMAQQKTILDLRTDPALAETYPRGVLEAGRALDEAAP